MPLRENHTNIDFTIRIVISLVLSSRFLLRRYASCLVWVGTTCRSVFRYQWSMVRRGAISHRWGQISVTLQGGLKTTCYGLSVCVFPQFICRNPNPRGDGARRRGLWEVARSWGGALTNGIGALTREAQRALLPLSPCEDTMGSLWPGRGFTQPGWQPGLRFLASRTVINK